MFERAAVRAGSIDGPEQLVQEVAVAVLHVDEVEARVGRECSGIHVGVDQRVEVIIGQDDDRFRCHALVEHRVVVRDLWLRRSSRA